MKSRIPYKTWLKDLIAARDKAKVSPWLLKAINAIIEALEKKDLSLACQLTAVKSHICGELTTPKFATCRHSYAFREDHDHNEKVLGHSLYVMLDIIHHDIAWKLDTIPSGMMIVSRKGVQEFKSEPSPHPVVRQICKEHEKNIKRSRS